jgi:hypothetical protein
VATLKIKKAQSMTAKEEKAIWNAAIKAAIARLCAEFYSPDVIIEIVRKEIRK